MTEIKIDDLIKDGQPDFRKLQDMGIKLLDSNNLNLFQNLGIKVITFQDLPKVLEHLGIKPMSDEQIKQFVSQIKAHDYTGENPANLEGLAAAGFAPASQQTGSPQKSPDTRVNTVQDQNQPSAVFNQKDADSSERRDP